MGTLSAAWVVALAATVANPAPQVVRDEVDLIEVNHYFDEHGKLVFDQLIFYDWSNEHCRYQVRAWRLLKQSSQFPLRDWETGEYSTIWYDGNVLRGVRSPALRETWTQHDPELAERAYLPKDCRVELSDASIILGDETIQR